MRVKEEEKIIKWTIKLLKNKIQNQIKNKNI